MSTRKAAKAAKPLTKARIVDKIMKDLEVQRKKVEQNKLTFIAPSRDEIIAKLPRVMSPAIWAESCGPDPVTAGSAMTYSVYVANTDASTYKHLEVYFFAGPADVVPDLGVALAGTDWRFPAKLEPRPWFTLGPGASTWIPFSITIPATIPPGAYLGNAVLFKLNSFDIGFVYDRVCFNFTVV